LHGSATPHFVIPSELRISYYAALKNDHVCGFLKESRMRFIETTKLDRKSGGSRGTCSIPFPLATLKGTASQAAEKLIFLKGTAFRPYVNALQ
jgi:hypothetical protein